MPKYLCLQRSLSSSDESEESGEGPSPSDMQDMYERFNEWRETFADNIEDPGGKLGDGTLVTDAPETDGPFAEVKELVGGYMILTAEDENEAKEVARACPGLVGERSGVEVIEIRTE